jgi:hypothetical protein
MRYHEKNSVSPEYIIGIQQENDIRLLYNYSIYRIYMLIQSCFLQGEALGDLYVDDYKSYAYRNGNYIHRVFSFKNNILQSRSVFYMDFIHFIFFFGVLKWLPYCQS